MRKRIICSTLISSVLTFNCFSHEAGDFIVRAGVANIQPTKETSSAVVIPGLPDTKINGISGDTQPGVTFSYMFTDNLAIEWILAAPFETSIQAEGGVPLVTGSSAIGTAKYLPEVISLQYYPMANDSKWQPYLGIGLNYTLFTKESTSSAINDSVAGASNLKVDNSTGLAAQLGLDYKLNDKWLVNAVVWYIDLKTDATVRTTNLGNIYIKDIEVDPVVFFLSIGYKF
jgi:outer membrane protein